MVNKYIKAFIAGSAYPIILSFYFIYFSAYFLLKPFGSPDTSFAFGVSNLLITPVLIGLANMLFIYFLEKKPTKNVNLRLIWFGVASGLILSSLGVFVFDTPSSLFGITNNLRYAPLIIAPIGYGIIWRFVIKFLNNAMGLK